MPLFSDFSFNFVAILFSPTFFFVAFTTCLFALVFLHNDDDDVSFPSSLPYHILHSSEIRDLCLMKFKKKCKKATQYLNLLNTSES